MPGRTILLINKFYHDIGPAGGVGRYILQEEQDLLAAGWTVVPFAIADEDAHPSPWSRFFVRPRDYSRARWSAGAAADALSLLWNREAARNLDRLIDEVRPDAAHIHNIYHHLSPAILKVLARRRIPTVQTLHDLRLLCPAIHMLRDGEVCERCRGGRFHHAVLGRCVKGSYAASLLAAAETWGQRTGRLYTDVVGRFLCPSEFLRGKYVEWGFPAEKLSHLPNFVDVDAWRPADDSVAVPGGEPTGFYFGRLSPEKGIATLLEAAARIEADPQGAALRLRIAGSGPAEAGLRARAAELGLRRVEFLGPLGAGRLREELAAARFTVLPSECYENGPLALLESFAAGVPVVGSDIGGIPEHIDDGRDGLLFAPGDPAALAAAMRRATLFGPEARAAARAKAVSRYGRAAHMARLHTVLEEAADSSAAPGAPGS